jgi:PIN domain nuclease of toxin-antitoxin system
MKRPILLDTCAAIWIPQDDSLTQEADQALREADITGSAVVVSSRDPADRILATTARAMNYRLMTRDERLLDYAASGNLAAIAC